MAIHFGTKDLSSDFGPLVYHWVVFTGEDAAARSQDRKDLGMVRDDAAAVHPAMDGYGYYDGPGRTFQDRPHVRRSRTRVGRIILGRTRGAVRRVVAPARFWRGGRIVSVRVVG